MAKCCKKFRVVPPFLNMEKSRSCGISSGKSGMSIRCKPGDTSGGVHNHLLLLEAYIPAQDPEGQLCRREHPDWSFAHEK